MNVLFYPRPRPLGRLVVTLPRPSSDEYKSILPVYDPPSRGAILALPVDICGRGRSGRFGCESLHSAEKMRVVKHSFGMPHYIRT